MLEIKDIYKTFNAGTINEKRALNGVNLNLNPGDFVTIIGGNGAGKSTTLNAIAGVWGIDKGNIIIDGTDITKLSEHKRALFLGRVFQDPMTGTAATMSIEENMAIAARRGQKRGLGWGVTKKEREHYREALKELDLGLEDRLSSKVGLLSGGQRQAITLLMASLKKPKLLLLDEHTAALDPKTAAKVLALSDKIISENKLTAMMGWSTSESPGTVSSFLRAAIRRSTTWDGTIWRETGIPLPCPFPIAALLETITGSIMKRIEGRFSALPVGRSW